MKVILGLVAPRSGTVTFDGARDHRPADASDHPRRRRLGAGGAAPVPADDGARKPADGRLCRAPTASAVARGSRRACWSCFPRVAERLDQRAGTLSGGEQQMVAMARALMGRPRLICMDEPTMGLSPLYRRPRAGTDRRDQPPGRHDLHGRAERQSRACRSRMRAMCCRPAGSSCTGPRRNCATIRAFATPISAALRRREFAPPRPAPELPLTNELEARSGALYRLAVFRGKARPAAPNWIIGARARQFL